MVARDGAAVSMVIDRLHGHAGAGIEALKLFVEEKPSDSD